MFNKKDKIMKIKEMIIVALCALAIFIAGLATGYMGARPHGPRGFHHDMMSDGCGCKGDAAKCTCEDGCPCKAKMKKMKGDRMKGDRRKSDRMKGDRMKGGQEPHMMDGRDMDQDPRASRPENAPEMRVHRPHAPEPMPAPVMPQ